MEFIVEKSDGLAKEFGDEKGDTYSRMAGRIAEIIEKYIKIAPRWNELVQDEEKDYKETLKRYFGTHQGVVETFLAKVIEKTKGVEERNAFVVALDKQGFGFAEGINIKIKTINNEQVIEVSYKKEKDGKVIFEHNEIVPKEVIDQIILEGKN